MRRDEHLNHARNDSDANCKYNGTSWAAPSGRAGFDLPWNELLHILRLGDQAGLLHLDASGLIYHAIAHRVAQLSFRRSRRLLAFGRQLLFCLMGWFDLISVPPAQCHTLELDQAGPHHSVASVEKYVLSFLISVM